MTSTSGADLGTIVSVHTALEPPAASRIPFLTRICPPSTAWDLIYGMRTAVWDARGTGATCSGSGPLLTRSPTSTIVSRPRSYPHLHQQALSGTSSDALICTVSPAPQRKLHEIQAEGGAQRRVSPASPPVPATVPQGSRCIGHRQSREGYCRLGSP